MDIYLSIIIPAYNEEKRIKENLRIIENYLKKTDFKYEIIVINDGSVDNTYNEIIASGVNIVLIKNKSNKGKGYSIKKAILQASGEIVVFLDADLATPISELPKIIEPLKNNQAQIAIGSRVIGKKDVERSFLRAMLGLIFRKLKSLILGINIFDSQCGFKGFKKEVIRPIFEKQTINSWSFDAEILLIATKLNYKIKEVPVYWFEQGDSKMKLVQEVPKMFWELFKIKKRHKKL